MNVIERFLKYVAVDTESVEDAACFPSSEKQKDLAKILVEELAAIGAQNPHMDEYGYVYATIPATSDKKVPALGFLAHMDTSPAMSGKDVKPRIVKNYDGGKIVLYEKENIFMDAAMFPSLSHNVGKDLIVTDGTTLLGADDKAGIAEIMTMAEILLADKTIPHGTIQIAFTPDEEVGAGVDHFDVDGFGAEFAYTVDGGALGEIEYENFNAASGRLKIHGQSIHPGSAKGKMVNALLVGMEFQQMLPVAQNPAYTEGYEGFFHLDRMTGGVEEAELFYIIRDHDKAKFEEKKARFEKTAAFLNEKYGAGTVECKVQDSYYNMKEKVEPYMFLIDNATKAMEDLGIAPIITPIRGGTDGARLSFMGLPCPNLCTGGENYHGKFEYVPVQDMEKIVEFLLQLIKVYQEA
ncbi:MAG: peptidase T [Lachnospiraceae bacterium]|nr:peptidase T [Lachnospiraceae bacterium]